MDNRITKKRLSDFLSYEWILIIITVVAAIVLLELFFTFLKVKTTPGQRFNYYYDENVYSDNDGVFIGTVNKGDTFSYDIREVSGEALSGDYNVLSVRLSTGDGDVIFTDNYEKQSGDGTTARVKTIIDSYGMFTFGGGNDEDGILFSAKKYLSEFLKEGEINPTVYANLDENKIIANFNERTKKERIYRNDLNAGLISSENEKERIKKLCEEVAFFEKVVEYDKTLNADDSIFYSYKKGEQTVNNGGKAPLGYEESYAKNYGINLSRLGEKARNTFRVKGDYSADVIVLAFDFRKQATDLQYETLSFINSIIRNYADFINLL